MEVPISAANDIDHSLTDHPRAPVKIFVGYASIKGIAWLQGRTVGRETTLFIGNTRRQYFSRATEAERAKALTFLERDDVRVLNWYRTERSKQGASTAHLKLWAVYNPDGSCADILTGSANLTGNGLHKNQETMARVTAKERERLHLRVVDLLDKAWDSRDRLIQYARGSSPTSQQAKRAHPPRPRLQKPAVRTKKRTGSGRRTDPRPSAEEREKEQQDQAGRERRRRRTPWWRRR